MLVGLRQGAGVAHLRQFAAQVITIRMTITRRVRDCGDLLLRGIFVADGPRQRVPGGHAVVPALVLEFMASAGRVGVMPYPPVRRVRPAPGRRLRVERLLEQQTELVAATARLPARVAVREQTRMTRASKQQRRLKARRGERSHGPHPRGQPPELERTDRVGHLVWERAARRARRAQAAPGGPPGQQISGRRAQRPTCVARCVRLAREAALEVVVETTDPSIGIDDLGDRARVVMAIQPLPAVAARHRRRLRRLEVAQAHLLDASVAPRAHAAPG